MNVFQAAALAYDAGTPCVLATVISVAGSTPRSSTTKMLILPNGTFVGTIGGGSLEHHVRAQAASLFGTGGCKRVNLDLRADLGMCCGGRVEVFLEVIKSRDQMLIFGAGHVARAVAPVLSSLDFAVTIIDSREDWCVPEAFPGCLVENRDPDTWVLERSFTKNTYSLIVTHDHALDQLLVEHLLQQPAAWIGMIGSKAKVARIFQRLELGGVNSSLFSRLSAPVGLDIGAETPAEIAVSIASEIVRVRQFARQTPMPLSKKAALCPAVPPLWASSEDEELR